MTGNSHRLWIKVHLGQYKTKLTCGKCKVERTSTKPIFLLRWLMSHSFKATINIVSGCIPPKAEAASAFWQLRYFAETPCSQHSRSQNRLPSLKWMGRPTFSPHCLSDPKPALKGLYVAISNSLHELITFLLAMSRLLCDMKNQTFSLSCLRKPLNNLLKLINAAGLLYAESPGPAPLTEGNHSQR